MKNFYEISGVKFSQFTYKNRKIFVLRDDLISQNPAFCGNKARKLDYFLNANLSEFKYVVSYGNSQSNAMLSLANFATLKGLDFKYIISHIDENLLKNPIGNLKFSLEKGMKLFIEKDPKNFAKSIVDKKTIFINEGVAQPQAQSGFIKQAAQIDLLSKNLGINFDIFLPSGTGISAYFLAKNTKFLVFTNPCVKNSEFLKSLLLSYGRISSNLKIINPPKNYEFAKPKIELFEIWKEICEISKIEFELIYDPIGFLTLFNNLDLFKNEILYIHQGGILGNISQIERYKNKFNLNFA